MIRSLIITCNIGTGMCKYPHKISCVNYVTVADLFLNYVEITCLHIKRASDGVFGNPECHPVA